MKISRQDEEAIEKFSKTPTYGKWKSAPHIGKHLRSREDGTLEMLGFIIAEKDGGAGAILYDCPDDPYFTPARCRMVKAVQEKIASLVEYTTDGGTSRHTWRR